MTVNPSTQATCCTITICGQQQISWRDLMMGTLELGGAVMSFAAFYFQQNNTMGGGTAAATVLTALVHWRWRNDAHGTREGEKKELKEIVTHSTDNDDQEIHSARKLSADEGALIMGLKKLGLIKISLANTSEQMEAKINNLEIKKKELKELKETTPRDQKLVLKQVITEFKEIHSELQRQSDELKELFEIEKERSQSGGKSEKSRLEEKEVLPLPDKKSPPIQSDDDEKSSHESV